MEYRVLNKNELDQLNYSDCFAIGCFDDELIGYIVLKDYLEIIDLYCRDFSFNMKDVLLEKIMKYGRYCIISSLDEEELFLRHGFYKENHNYRYDYELFDFKSYDEVHEFISNQKDRVYSLDNFKKFMDDYCNPQFILKCIHIGGTNGKGSTTNYIRSVLQSADYKVGTFTSPVLITRREVMKINNECISEDDVVFIANRYMNDWLKYEISMFEIEMFISVLYFIYNCVDFVVYEVGLGGELDATNVIYSILSAITNIGLDHVEYLGNNYEAIARTKSGIIKHNSLFVTSEVKQECLDIFKEVTCDKNTLFYHSQKCDCYELNPQLEFKYKDYDVRLNTSALYQLSNCILAIDILELLKEYGHIQYTQKQLLEGLYNTYWPGRFEVVNHNPLMIIDGAHNKEGMKAFVESAKNYDNIKIIFSALKDKDTSSMMELLLEVSDDITVCEFDFYRAQKAELLAGFYPVKIEKDWKKAIEDAFLHRGTVFITGSLYFISKVREYLKNRN